LSHPANIEHPAKLLAQKQRRFDSVRDKVRPWVTSRPEFSVVSRVKDEDQIEQHGPGDSFSSVSVGVYLEARRRNIHFREAPRHYRNVLGMEDESWPLGAAIEELTDVPVWGKTRMHTDDAVTPATNGAYVGSPL